jgi:hypothetical protein
MVNVRCAALRTGCDGIGETGVKGAVKRGSLYVVAIEPPVSEEGQEILLRTRPRGGRLKK